MSRSPENGLYSAFSDDEEEVEAQRAMEEWIDEVNLLLCGLPKHASKQKQTTVSKRNRGSVLLGSLSSPVPNKAAATATRRHSGTPSSRPKLLHHPGSISPDAAAEWFKPGRSPPPPKAGSPVLKPSSPLLPEQPVTSPLVPWRRYVVPLPERPEPPTIPLPERPPATEVPVDMEDWYDAYSLPSPGPSRLSPLPTYLFRICTVFAPPLTQAPPAITGPTPSMRAL